MKMLEKMLQICLFLFTSRVFCMRPQLQPAMLFDSQYHGPKVDILDNGHVARRYEGCCYAVAFGNRPLSVGEKLKFNISEVENGWLSNMNVGIVYTDPISIRDLVTCDENITTDIPDTRVFIFEKFYADDNVYEFWVDKHGVAYLAPNVTSDDVVFTGVDVKKTFWPIFNVFGDAKAIELLTLPDD